MKSVGSRRATVRVVYDVQVHHIIHKYFWCAYGAKPVPANV